MHPFGLASWCFAAAAVIILAARLRGLTEYLSSMWSIPVEVARPFERIDVEAALADEARAAGPALAVAVGLALRRPGERRE